MLAIAPQRTESPAAAWLREAEEQVSSSADDPRRDKQKPPDGDWSVWLVQGGAGSGKTLSGALWMHDQVAAGAKHLALIGPTAADVRDTMIHGPSGLLGDHGYFPAGRPEYRSSWRRVVWPGGAEAVMYSAEEPERLRGLEFERAWADEIDAWGGHRSDVGRERALYCWDLVEQRLRRKIPEGHPQIAATSTPRPGRIIAALTGRDDVARVVIPIWENADNLDPKYLEKQRKRWEGTRWGRQELEGELIEEIEGALWRAGWISDNRRDECTPERIVVGVDPGERRAGIVVAAKGDDGEFYVLSDKSKRNATPEQWARQAVNACRVVDADRIVVERNFGGQMAQATIRQVDGEVPVKEVSASRGKHIRAEPIAALYEQGRVHHVGNGNRFSDLEDQLLAFTADGYVGSESPDNADALIWALTELALGAGPMRKIKVVT